MPRRPMAKRATGADGATTVRGKRANGAGSVYFDQANECYFATWRDSAGKRRKVRGTTQADAELRRIVAIEEHEAATRARDSRFTPATTVHELGVWWLANVAPHRMRPSSVGAVGKRLTSDRLGVLADVAITALTSEQVQEWQSGLLRGRHALSPSTVADTRVTLNQVLDCAVDHRLIEINPARRVKPPRVRKAVAVTSTPPMRNASSLPAPGLATASSSPCCSCRGGGCPRCSGSPGPTSTSTQTSQQRWCAAPWCRCPASVGHSVRRPPFHDDDRRLHPLPQGA